MHQRRIARWVGRNCDQSRIERPGVGQPCAGACAALGGGFRHRVNDEAMRPFDREDDRHVRR
jgi:hypothetical protein